MKIKIEITSWGTIWFDDYTAHGGYSFSQTLPWYHPFRDFIGNNYHGFKKDRKDCCVWMILE